MQPLKRNKEHVKYIFPARILDAQHHKICTQAGLQYLPSQSLDCPCCERRQHLKLAFCFSHRQTFLYGSGISIFFTMLFFIMIWMGIKFVLSDLTRILSANQPAIGTQYDRWEMMATRIEGYGFESGWIDVGTVLVLLCMSVWMRRQQFILDQQADAIVNSQSDYNIFVKDLPHMFNGMEDIQRTIRLQLNKMVETKVRSLVNLPAGSDFNDYEIMVRGLIHRLMEAGEPSQDHVVQVNVVYNINTVEHIKQIGRKIADEILVSLEENDLRKADQLKSLLAQLIQAKEAELHKFKSSRDPGERVANFTGKAFVAFAYEAVRDYVLQDYRMNSQYWNFQGLGQLSMQLADNPSSIKWQNMHLTRVQKFHRILIGSLTVVMFIIYSMIILFFLQQADYAASSNHSTAASFLSTIIALFITVTNAILDILISYVIEYQCPLSVSQQKATEATYSFVAKFTNTSIIMFLISLLVKHEYYGNAGLFANISQFMFTNAVISTFMILLNPPLLIRWAKITYYRCFKEKEGTLNFYQGDLNKEFEYPQFPIATIYTSVLNVVMTSMFFSWGQPYLSLIAALQIGVAQLIYRWHFTSFSSLKHEINLELSWFISTLFEIGVLMFSISNMIFPLLTGNHFKKAPVIIQLSISSIYILVVRSIPALKFQRLLCLKSDISTTEYKSGKESFPEHFVEYNPCYH